MEQGRETYSGTNAAIVFCDIDFRERLALHSNGNISTVTATCVVFQVLTRDRWEFAREWWEFIDRIEG